MIYFIFIGDIMTKIVTLYHSIYGHTEAVAKSVHKGVASISGVNSQLMKVEEAITDITILEDADAIIFGAPTYMGSISAEFKKFMEISSKPWFEQKWKNKIAAGFTNSGSLSGDKFNSLMQLVTFASQHSMIWVSLGMLNESATPGNSGNPDAVNRTGTYLGLATQADNLPANQAPPAGDHKTAELFGKRVAEITIKFRNH